jgi:hypothetical protein
MVSETHIDVLQSSFAGASDCMSWPCSAKLGQEDDSPSMRHSLTISHRRFMSASGRYLQPLACSSHSSGPAPFERRAGPGWGTSLSLGAMSGMDGACAVDGGVWAGRVCCGESSNGGSGRRGRVTAGVGVVRGDVAALGCLAGRRGGCSRLRRAMGEGQRRGHV